MEEQLTPLLTQIIEKNKNLQIDINILSII
jgi:hypothetical protein